MITNFDAFRGIELEHMLIALERVPFDPAFERCHVQALEKSGG